MINTKKYLIQKFQIDTTKPSPFYIPFGRNRDIPKLFVELGFNIGAEIGVWRGAYSYALLRRIPNLKLYGIDAWQPYRGYKDYPDDLYQIAHNLAKDRVKGYNCELIKGWSNETCNYFSDEFFDFVFIDGNHSYEGVVEDLANWAKKVRKGGIVYGHDFDDYSSRKRWKEMGVINAVTGWCNQYRIHPLYVLTNNRQRSWLYVKE